MKFRQLTYTDRVRLEVLYNSGKTPREISLLLHKHISTIYREIKRGIYDHLNPDYTYSRKYSANLAQRSADYNATAKGLDLKISNDFEYLEFIEGLILNGFSPDAALGFIRNNDLHFSTTVCTTTLYKYIDMGLFQRITNKNLLRKGSRRRPYHKVKTVKRPPRGESIENRPDHINNRIEFGHWEMDSVVGKKNKGQSLLVLTERKTRREIILKVHRQTADETVRALDKLERSLGRSFSDVFRSITVDNGSEFSAYHRMQQSCLGNYRRTTLYYCHPYSSWERGTNENHNAMIRRFIPKGKRMERYSQTAICEISAWMNDYPRRIFNYKTPNQLFDGELSKLNIPEKKLKNFRNSY